MRQWDTKRLFALGGLHSLVQLRDTEAFQPVAAIKGLMGFGSVGLLSDDSLLTIGRKTADSEAWSATLWRASSCEEIRAEERTRAAAK